MNDKSSPGGLIGAPRGLPAADAGRVHRRKVSLAIDSIDTAAPLGPPFIERFIVEASQPNPVILEITRRNPWAPE